VFTFIVMLVLALLGFTNFSHSLPLNDKFLHFMCLGIATGVFYFIFDVEECASHWPGLRIDSHHPLATRGGYGSGAIPRSSSLDSSVSLQGGLSAKSCNLCYPYVCGVWFLAYRNSSELHSPSSSKSGTWWRTSLGHPSVFIYPTT